MRPTFYLALCLAAAAMPAPSRAQPQPQPPSPAAPPSGLTLQLVYAEGNRLPPMAASDLSVAFERSFSSSQDPDRADYGTDQASVTLDMSALSDPALITWIGQARGDASAELKVTAGGREITYVLSGIAQCVMNMTHGGASESQLNLTLVAKHLTVNGAAVN